MDTMDRESILSLPESPGVYEIRNLENDRNYIGSAGHQGIRKRIRQHIADLEKGKHHSWKLQRDWDHFGSEAFRALALETLPTEEVRAAEQKLLDAQESLTSYNIMDKAGRESLPKGMKENIRKSLRKPKTFWSTNKSGYRGVCWSKRQAENGSPPWKASIHRNGKSYHVGYYDTPRKAYNAYKEAFALPDRDFEAWFERLREERGNGQRGSRRPQAKLSEMDVRKIRRLYKARKSTQAELAARFDVDPSHICRIVNLKHRIHG